jgi:4a-hydroxytetrahydrobiopterin dehydratase
VIMEALTSDQIKKELSGLNGWVYEGDKIKKEFKFSNFKEAISFMVKVGFEAEAQGHHPEWFNVYNKVSVQLSTHDAGGKVTSKDIKLAKTIDEIAD